MSSVSVAELWWMDPRITTRDIVGGERMRRPQTRDLRLLTVRLTDALGNVSGARDLAERHRAKGNDVQAERWRAEADRQAAIANALHSAITWLLRDAVNPAAFSALLRKFSGGTNGPIASTVWSRSGPQPPPLLAGTATPRAPTRDRASVSA